MNSFISTDTKLCIGCKTCEIACVIAHHEESVDAIDAQYFHPRLKVMKEGDVTGPVTCRQCDGAPCLSACMQGAITQNNGIVEVDQEKCIGCGACSMACPYGAMTVATRKTERMLGGEQAGFSYKSEALKCDLCVKRVNGNGPACVELCPTKALHLIEAKALMKAKEDRQVAALMATKVMAEVNALAHVTMK